MRTVPALVLIAVVLLGGCSMPFGGSGAPAESVTPAPVPTQPAPVEVGGDFDPLLSAHRAALNETAYTFQARYFLPTGPEEENRSIAEGYFGSNDSRFLLWISRPTVESASWSNGTVLAGFQNRTEDGQRHYSLRREPPRALPDVTRALIAPELRAAVVTKVVDRKRGYVVHGRIRQDDEGDDPFDRYQNGTVVVRVAPSGLIQRFELRTPAADGPITVTFARTTAGLPRPDWVDTAIDREANESRTTSVPPGGATTDRSTGREPPTTTAGPG